MMLFLFTLLLNCYSKVQDRLEHDATPSHYNLYFDLQDEQFKGSVGINFEANKDSKIIKLNADGLEIKKAKLEYNSEIQEGRATLENEVLTLTFDEAIVKGRNYVLTLNFSGKYSQNIDGIYKSDYFGKTIISTHFEPTFARKAFPCFDQPDLKATFSIKVRADSSYPVVLSNTSEKSLEQGVHVFEKTVPMSTYLVAFVVGHLDFIETRSKSNIPIRVYADKKDIQSAKYALDVAKEALDFFEKYFGINYQFPKLDLVPIPSFANGAMENWGLVTFRRSSLLYSPEINTTISKLRVAQTVCHELAHMWFGNLVTMTWWNDLWLNEGFATWASFMALHNISDKLVDLDVWMNFINEDLERGMDYDSLHSSHPIAVTVQNPSEINQIFDSISYSKGASILRMMENYLGHKVFRDNITKYLEQHKMNNSRSSELFENVPNSKTTSKMLQTWIKQEGFPIIKVTEGENNIKLEQTRFLAGKKNNGDKNWIIPVTLTYTDKEPVSYLMENKIINLPLDSINYKLNFSNTGVYRVLYPEKTFERILQSEFDSKEKLNVVNDMFNLAFGGYLNIKWVIKTIKKNLVEREHEILKSILKNAVVFLKIYSDDQKAVMYIKSFINEIFSPLYPTLDFKKQSKNMNDRLKQSLILSGGLIGKNSTIKERLKEDFKIFKTKKEETNPDYSHSMFNVAVNDDFEWVLDYYRTNKNSVSRTTIVRALGSGISKLEHLEKMLKLYKEIERQDFIYFVSGLSSNYKFKKQAITFFINNFEEIKEYINNENLLNSVFESLFCGVSDEDLRKQVESFTSNLKLVGSERTIRKVNEINQIYTQFKQDNKNIFD